MLLAILSGMDTGLRPGPVDGKEADVFDEFDFIHG